MTPTAFIEALSARGVHLWRDPSGVLHYDAPRGVMTPYVIARIQSALPHILPLVALQETMVEHAVTVQSECQRERKDAGRRESVTLCEGEEEQKQSYAGGPPPTAHLEWQQGHRIPWMVSVWVGSPDWLRTGVVRHHGFGDTPTGALHNLLATLTPRCPTAHVRALCQRVQTERDTLPTDTPIPSPLNLATTAHGLPPVFAFLPQRPGDNRLTLQARFPDGSYLDAHAPTDRDAWTALRQHPAATPEQLWWIEKAATPYFRNEEH